MRLVEVIAHQFQTIQTGILIFGALSILFFIKGRSQPSQFKQRESDRTDLDRILKQGPDTGQAKQKPKSAANTPPPPPLSLPGIRLNGAPHEILGVREDASESEVMRAYKDAIKRFHPDTIQGAAREQMQFYQDASARINEAKDQMIKKIRS
jgi:DnaJ-domain-containing protein 1